ncbi:hypothetical protein ADN00_09310 [Ornatilinea apprima]|uniref:Capsule synthesis protein CapA domain-containing protein n=1 Tax=Ornatilinea apprima TaxID=1134406 RepID=A0A0P6Y6V5_9CHLR|nr:CapA family protein [Ornatilinea apprima]KPL77315.1 hypothetical protein ADN00_09310 [Ornatilinea apprima]
MIKVLVAGDFCPLQDRNLLENWILDQQIFQDHDIRILNLEGPLTDNHNPILKIGPNLRIDPCWASVIAASGFNVVTLANNHILDMGEKGLIETIHHCDQSGIGHVGAGKNISDARKPLIMDMNGARIGFLAFTENEFSIASEACAGAAPIDPVANYYSIKEIREKLDYLILICHGGNELFKFPRPGMISLSRYYSDIGADAIIWHHSHVPCGYEIYNGTHIFYGTGNFYFPHKKHTFSDWYTGYLVSLELQKNKISSRIIPYKFDLQKISFLAGTELSNFTSDLEHLCDELLDTHKLQRRWKDHCYEKRKYYISTLIANSRCEKLLFRLDVLKEKYYAKKLRFLRNLIECESHRELLLELLR